MHVSAIVSSLKAHVRFFWSPGARLSVPPFVNIFSKTTGPISANLAQIIYPWAKGKEIYVLYQDGIIAFFHRRAHRRKPTVDFVYYLSSRRNQPWVSEDEES